MLHRFSPWMTWHGISWDPCAMADPLLSQIWQWILPCRNKRFNIQEAWCDHRSSPPATAAPNQKDTFSNLDSKQTHDNHLLAGSFVQWCVYIYKYICINKYAYYILYTLYYYCGSMYNMYIYILYTYMCIYINTLFYT